MNRNELSTIKLEEPVNKILDKMSADFLEMFSAASKEDRPTIMYSAMVTGAAVQKKVGEGGKD